jgi:hypothetical protein
MMIVRVLDYNAHYDYCPPIVEAAINPAEIVSALPCESRYSSPTMVVRFTNGSTLTVVGKPTDLVEPDHGQ